MSQYPQYPSQAPQPPQWQAPSSQWQTPPPPPPQMPGMPSASAIQLPPQILQQASYNQLGTPLQVYTPNIWTVYVLPAAVLLIVLLDLMGLPSDGSFGAVLILLILIVVLIITVIRFFAGFNLKVYTFAEGLLRVKGSQIDVIRWDQTEAVWQKIIRYRRYFITIYTSYKYTVRRRDSAEFKFTGSLKNIKQLGENIQQEIARRHMPQAIAAYNNGAPLNFGPYVLNTQGISYGNALIPWYQIHQVTLKRGWVAVQDGSTFGKFRTNVQRIPNLIVFLRMVDYARQQGNRM